MSSELSKEAAAFIASIRKKMKAAARPNYLQEAEKIIGRPLEDYEAVMFKDGNRENLVAENILVGFKAGVPYQYLTCRHCGNRVIGLELPTTYPRSSDSLEG